MQIIDIKFIVADISLCKQLVSLGVTNASCLAWEQDGSLVIAFDASEDAVPAFTMDELGIALGGSIDLPCIAKPRPRPAPDEDIMWQYYYPDKSKEYKSAASACADVLIHCLKNQVLDLNAVNNRLERKFKPF